MATRPRGAPHLLLVGGGSAGHVIPSIPLIDHFRARGWSLSYVGSADGPEHGLIAPLGVPFHVISVGKLRRYFSLQNLTDLFRTGAGVWQAWRLLQRLRPDVVFSKGGYVSVPVVMAAWLRGIPVVAHESDLTPGLANRLAMPFVSALCTNFPGTRVGGEGGRRRAPRVVRTGTPLRPALTGGDPAKGRAMCGAPPDRQLLVVVGGSLGAAAINRTVWAALPELTERFFVVHVCGRGARLPALEAVAGYRAYEFVGDGWGDILAAADLVVSRAGANALYELLALGKPHLLIPLSRAASRGDQIENAAYAEEAGLSVVLPEEDLNSTTLVDRLGQMSADLDHWRARLHASEFKDGTQAVADVIQGVLKDGERTTSGRNDENRVR
jgi:UDP-N-acetylglucosamine--N-acetylmuramyl-(pentapeptide) pyrophosphoryl-undecaprenol N-acetylglucosamine transferase